MYAPENANTTRTATKATRAAHAGCTGEQPVAGRRRGDVHGDEERAGRAHQRVDVDQLDREEQQQRAGDRRHRGEGVLRDRERLRCVAFVCERTGEARRRGHVGVHRAHREQDGEQRGDPTARLAEARGHQVGERDVGLGTDADRRRREAEVEHDHDRDGGTDRARELLRRVLELAREMRSRLPADEREHEHARRAADRQPAVRRERRPVLGLAVRERGDDRDEQQRAQQGGEPELQTSRRMQARGVGRQHDRDHRRGRRDGRATPRAEQLGDVEATHQRHRRRADHDAAEEPPAGRGAGAAAERLAHVRRRPARLGLTRAERGERGRERDRQRQQRRPRR